MQVLALYGSPRLGGNSSILLDAVIRGVERSGGVVERARLAELNINPCIACGGCDLTGECVIIDDMTNLYDRIIEIDRIVVASPIYFYGITAQTKAFVDRCQALWSRKRLLKEAGRWALNTQRKGYFVSVGATKGSRVFEGAGLTMKYAFDAMDMAYGGEFLVKSVEGIGEMEKSVKTMADAERFGMTIMNDM
ncbi:MAG: flavodoxin [Deltaproteobacteria bacterium RIFOXYD12_FULL_50_9]|nr:MAG: flavodoxin [Deltaproteobacteria bacterium RIFOXYD12_FULL_50_9]